MIIQIFYAVFFMYVWFETDALVEYSKLFGLKRLLRIDRWESYREINPRLEYFDYLRMNHPSFLIKLFTCPPCILVWISMASASFFSSFYMFPLVYVFSYIIYKLICKLKKF